jgi:hypothetical protein
MRPFGLISGQIFGHVPENDQVPAAIAITDEKSAGKFSLVCTAHQCDKFAAVAVATLDD